MNWLRYCRPITLPTRIQIARQQKLIKLIKEGAECVIGSYIWMCKSPWASIACFVELACWPIWSTPLGCKTSQGAPRGKLWSENYKTAYLWNIMRMMQVCFTNNYEMNTQNRHYSKCFQTQLNDHWEVRLKRVDNPFTRLVIVFDFFNLAFSFMGIGFEPGTSRSFLNVLCIG